MSVYTLRSIVFCLLIKIVTFYNKANHINIPNVTKGAYSHFKKLTIETKTLVFLSGK